MAYFVWKCCTSDLSCFIVFSLLCRFLFFLQLTSQHPYAEVFIGEPHVVTVDIGNLSLVEDTVKRILNLEVSIFLKNLANSMCSYFHLMTLLFRY